jgi:hypothetical protein
LRRSKQIPNITEQQKPDKGKKIQTTITATSVNKTETNRDCKIWTDEEVDRLLKACTQFDANLNDQDRWQKIR